MTALALALALAAAPFPARCRATLARAEAAPRSDLHDVLTSLEPPEVDGRRAELPSLGAAADALATSPTPAARDAALLTLRALCAQSGRAETAPAPVDPARLRSILQRPQFAQRRGGEWALGRLLERLWDVIKELLQQKAVKGYSNLARAAFLAAVALLAVYLALRLWRARGDRRVAIAEPAPEPRRSREATVTELLAQAEAALAAGDAHGAVRAQMRAVLAALAARDLTDRRGAATNREVASALAARGEPELARAAASLAARFDRAIYGGAPLDLDAAASFGREAAALRSQVEARP